MSMTTESKAKEPHSFRRLTTATATIACILLAWFSATAAITLISGAAPFVKVIFPGQQFMNALPDDIYVLDWSGPNAILYSKKPDFVRDLYRAGALLVLPARRGGCLSISREKVRRTA